MSRLTELYAVKTMTGGNGGSRPLSYSQTLNAYAPARRLVGTEGDESVRRKWAPSGKLGGQFGMNR